MYDIRLFGRLEVRTRGVRLAGRDFGGVKPRHILALLALRGALHADELTELLWNGRPPANHVAGVQSYVSVLRHRLDPDGHVRDSVIATAAGGYALVADRVRVDVARFDELVTVAAARTAGRALPPLTAAAHLADRPLLVEERSGWARDARDTYRTRLLEALLDAAGCALATGRPWEAVRLAERAVGLDPVAERGWAVAIAGHRALGNRVAALRAYDRCRRELADTLGVEPSPATRALFLDLLHDGGAGAAVDGALCAVLAAADERPVSAAADERPVSSAVLLRRAAELVA
jgi:DNA-binding SARP family transcriptional activator